MLVNICSIRKVISYGGCVAQLFISLALGSTECLLLAVMSLIGLCYLLASPYSVIMHQNSASSWQLYPGLVASATQYCSPPWPCRCHSVATKKWITFCEVPALLKLSCRHNSKWSWAILSQCAIPSNTCDTHSDIICFYCPSSVENKISGRSAKGIWNMWLPFDSGVSFMALLSTCTCNHHPLPPRTGERWYPFLWNHHTHVEPPLYTHLGTKM